MCSRCRQLEGGQCDLSFPRALIGWEHGRLVWSPNSICGGKRGDLCQCQCLPFHLLCLPGPCSSSYILFGHNLLSESLLFSLLFILRLQSPMMSPFLVLEQATPHAWKMPALTMGFSSDIMSRVWVMVILFSVSLFGEPASMGSVPECIIDHILHLPF